MIHANGRHPIAKMGYLEVGKQIGISLGHIDLNKCKGGDDFTWLKQEGYPDITELLPQRTSQGALASASICMFKSCQS